MSCEEKNLRWKMYNEHKKQVWQDIQANSDSFDQSLLKLSSAILTLSLAFIKNIVPFKDAIDVCALYSSWISLAICILLTVASYLVSGAALNKQLGFLYFYYIKYKKEYHDKESWQSKALPWMAIAAGVLFLAGVGLTLIFCINNIVNLRSMRT